MPRVRFKPITWYIEMHHERKFFVWRHDFFALRDHSQHVYLQEESLPPFVSCRMRLKNCSEFVLIIFYLQLINSGHVDSSMANKKHGKLCLIIEDKRCEWTSQDEKVRTTPAQEKCPHPHVVHFDVPRDWFETNSRHHEPYSENGEKFRGCRGLLGRVVSFRVLCDQLHKIKIRQMRRIIRSINYFIVINAFIT